MVIWVYNLSTGVCFAGWGNIDIDIEEHQISHEEVVLAHIPKLGTQWKGILGFLTNRVPPPPRSRSLLEPWCNHRRWRDTWEQLCKLCNRFLPICWDCLDTCHPGPNSTNNHKNRIRMTRGLREVVILPTYADNLNEYFWCVITYRRLYQQLKTLLNNVIPSTVLHVRNIWLCNIAWKICNNFTLSLFHIFSIIVFALPWIYINQTQILSLRLH